MAHAACASRTTQALPLLLLKPFPSLERGSKLGSPLQPPADPTPIQAGLLPSSQSSHICFGTLEKASLGNLKPGYHRDFPPADPNFDPSHAQQLGLCKQLPQHGALRFSRVEKQHSWLKAHYHTRGQLHQDLMVSIEQIYFVFISMALSNLGEEVSANRTFATHLPGGTIQNPLAGR